jgi:protease I
MRLDFFQVLSQDCDRSNKGRLLMATAPTAFQALLATETSAAFPRISGAQLLDAPENAALRQIWTDPPGEPAVYAGKHIGVIATDGVEEIELTTILHFFRTRGAVTHLIAPKKPKYPAYLGMQIPAVRETHILTIRYIETAGWVAFDKTVDEIEASTYDALIVPGGTWNPDTLRSDLQVRRLLQEAAAAGKITAAICHGPWVLSDAGLLKGKRVTAWWSTQPDLENAGATFVDAPVVVDGNVVTSRAPIDLPPFVHAVGQKFSEGSVKTRGVRRLTS